MIRIVMIELSGTKVPLFYNNRAMFRLQKQLGDEWLKATDGMTEEAFRATLEVLSVLNEEGETARRRMGYDPLPMVDAAQMELDLSPADWLAAKNGISAAVMSGVEREVEPAEDVDLVLLEYQKKTGPHP